MKKKVINMQPGVFHFYDISLIDYDCRGHKTAKEEECTPHTGGVISSEGNASR